MQASTESSPGGRSRSAVPATFTYASCFVITPSSWRRDRDSVRSVVRSLVQGPWIRTHKLDVHPQIFGSLKEREVSRGEFLASEHRHRGNPSIGTSENSSVRKGLLKSTC